MVAVAFKKIRFLNAFLHISEENFRLLASEAIRFASLYGCDRYNCVISPVCELIASNGVSPLSHKIHIKANYDIRLLLIFDDTNRLADIALEIA